MQVSCDGVADMRAKVPVVAVLGSKDSGKTTVVERVVLELERKGYRVATAKHITLKGFSVDTEGKDTWRHSAAGANPVVTVSDVETAVLMKDGESRFSMDQMSEFAPEADAIVLEGFSWLTLKDHRVGKVFCVTSRREYESYRRRARGETIAFCCRRSMGRSVLRIPEDSPVLVKQVLAFVEREQETSEILSELPELNCGKCGYKTCRELAEAIYQGKAKLGDCVPLKLRPKLKTRIIIDDGEVPIQPFVSKVIRSALLGMVSSLKGVSIRGDEEIQIKISKR